MREEVIGLSEECLFAPQTKILERDQEKEMREKKNRDTKLNRVPLQFLLPNLEGSNSYFFHPIPFPFLLFEFCGAHLSHICTLLVTNCKKKK